MRYGIDLHTTTFMVAWREVNGTIKRKKYFLTPEGMDSFKSILTTEDILAIESTMTSYYFYDQLQPFVAEIIIVNPFRFKVISESRAKTDKRDCATILEYLEHGLLPGIPIPKKEIRDLRRIFSTYLLTVKSRTSFKNRIYSLLKSEGVVLPKGDLYSRRGIDELNALGAGAFCQGPGGYGVDAGAVAQRDYRMPQGSSAESRRPFPGIGRSADLGARHQSLYRSRSHCRYRRHR